MRLAFCISLKNRCRNEVDPEDSHQYIKPFLDKLIMSPYPMNNFERNEDKIILTLFPKMVRSLIEQKKATDDWVLVVTDFGSTDVNVQEMLEKIIGDVMPFHVHTETNWKFFDRGGGLKTAAKIAEEKFQADSVFFCDADLIFHERDVFDECYRALENDKFFYPVFFAFADTLHLNGFWRDTSFGNFAGTLSNYKKTAGWKHNISWGWEDRALADSIPQEQKVRKQVNGFCHQWHPMVWEFRVAEYPVKEYLFKKAAVSTLPQELNL